MLFSSNSPRSSERADVPPSRRCSTTISMMEEEFGMREPPQAVTRFGLPPMLKILPPKRKKTLTQVPEPRRNSSFLKGSWETVWAYDVDDMDFVESPPEDVDPPLDSVPDQESGLDEVVATPTNGTLTPCSTDGEITPRFSSNFPSPPDSTAMRYEDHSLQASPSRHGSADLHAS